MGDINLVAANLSTVSMESFLYGIFFMLSGASCYLLLQRERLRRGRLSFRDIWRNPMAVPSIIIMIAVTMHWVLVVTQSFIAFIYFMNGTLPILEYANYATVPWTMKIAVLDITLVTFDAVMIYRAWILWNRDFRAIALSALFFLGESTCSVGQIYALSHYKLGENLRVVNIWVDCATVLTLCTNLSCAALISRKLWSAHSKVQAVGVSLLSVLAIVVESAAIYVAWSVGFLVTYLVFSNLRDPFLDLWAPIAGIAFMLINVRVGAGWGKNNQYPPSTGSLQFRSGTDNRGQDVYEMPRVSDLATTTTEFDDISAADSKPVSFTNLVKIRADVMV